MHYQKECIRFLLLVEKLGAAEREDLIAALTRRSLTREQAAALVVRVRQAGYAARTREFAAEYVARAKKALAAFPASPETDRLLQAADFILTRTK